MDITKPWKKKFFKIVPIKDADGKIVQGDRMVPMSTYWKKPENRFGDEANSKQQR